MALGRPGGWRPTLGSTSGCPVEHVFRVWWPRTSHWGAYGKGRATVGESLMARLVTCNQVRNAAWDQSARERSLAFVLQFPCSVTSSVPPVHKGGLLSRCGIWRRHCALPGRCQDRMVGGGEERRTALIGTVCVLDIEVTHAHSVAVQLLNRTTDWSPGPIASSIKPWIVTRAVPSACCSGACRPAPAHGYQYVSTIPAYMYR